MKWSKSNWRPDMDAIETYRAQKKEMQNKLKEFGQETFKPFFLNLFEAHPEAQAVRWTQYTPSFNDGDPCVFQVNSPEATGVVIIADEEYDDEEDWHEAWDGEGAHPLSAVADQVEKFFEDIDDVMHEAFGDGVQVTVQRNGTITVDDYCHD